MPPSIDGALLIVVGLAAVLLASRIERLFHSILQPDKSVADRIMQATYQPGWMALGFIMVGCVLIMGGITTFVYRH